MICTKIKTDYFSRESAFEAEMCHAFGALFFATFSLSIGEKFAYAAPTPESKELSGTEDNATGGSSSLSYNSDT